MPRRAGGRAYKHANTLKVAEICEMRDPTHATRCRIGHIRTTSIINALSGVYSDGCCTAYLLAGYCNDADCRARHPEEDYYDDGGDVLNEVPRWATMHARIMNRALWNEIWLLEHQVHFLREQLTRLKDPRRIAQQDRKHARRQEKREREAVMRDARRAHEQAPNSD
jgi:hypothetical protein